MSEIVFCSGIADYIDDCNYLFENMPLLQLNLTFLASF